MVNLLTPILFPNLSLFLRTMHFGHPSVLSRFCLFSNTSSIKTTSKYITHYWTNTGTGIAVIRAFQMKSVRTRSVKVMEDVTCSATSSGSKDGVQNKTCNRKYPDWTKRICCIIILKKGRMNCIKVQNIALSRIIHIYCFGTFLWHPTSHGS